MSKTRVDDLIQDLFGLYSRYGRVEFERAIKALESGKELRSLLSLTTAAQTSFMPKPTNMQKRVTAPRKAKSPRQRLDEFLADLGSRGGEESNLVARFVSDVAERRLLRSANLTLQAWSKVIVKDQN